MGQKDFFGQDVLQEIENVHESFVGFLKGLAISLARDNVGDESIFVIEAILDHGGD
jgi:hypothetical protein